MMTLRRTPVAGCFRRTTGLYPKSLSTKKTISSSRIRVSLLQTTLSQRCSDAFSRASSSSVPAPADVLAGGTAGTIASGHAEIRCSPSLTNSECNRRTSRNCVVRNFGRLVYGTGQCQGIMTFNTMWIGNEHRHQIAVQGPSFRSFLAL